MNLGFAVFYGILQGLTEFLPISSSGHLALLQSLTGRESAEAGYFSFEILLHLATLLAVCVVYRRDIFALVPAFFTASAKLIHGKLRLTAYTESERTVILLVAASLPLCLGVFLKDYVEMLYGCTKLIGAVLILNGAMLLLSDCVSRRKNGRTAQDATLPQAFAVGFCQLCALIPGLSRSGSTITGGLLCGFDRRFAVKFSFLLSVPAVLGANLLNVKELCQNPVPSASLLPCICGMAAAAVTGMLAMKLLDRLSKKAGFSGFGFYCAAIGLLAVIFG